MEIPDLTRWEIIKIVFGAQTIEMNEMTCCNEKPSTFCEADKKSTQNHENHVLGTLEAV